MSNYVVGVDVGGTNVKLGLVNSKGQVIVRTSFATTSFSSCPTALINAIAAHIKTLILEAKVPYQHIIGIGVGLPGLIDPVKGVVRFLPNIPGWHNVRLGALLKTKTGLPVYIDNDVKMITLAEARFGAGRGVKNMVCLTLGTGVGAGLILDGRLYRGQANAAGELGHMPLNEHGPLCTCGGSACYERYVGNKALFALAVKISGIKGATTELMYARAKQGDKKALLFWRKAATHIGNGLVGIVNLLNPTLIVIGGGVSNNQEFLFPTIRDVLKKRCMSLQGGMVRIKRAQFKDNAGLIGAYVLVNDAR